MISKIGFLPEIAAADVAFVKLKCLYDSYRDDDAACFWQSSDGAFLSLYGRNMTISDGDIDIDELRDFLRFTFPQYIFCSENLARELNAGRTEPINVMYRFGDAAGETLGDTLSSKEIYDILNCPSFTMPDYADFAVDWCHRLNRGFADYYGLKGKCAAISFNSGDYAVINGIASREKGCGGKALNAITEKNCGRHIFACCEDSVTGFYEKYGFKKLSKRFALINEY